MVVTIDMIERGVIVIAAGRGERVVRWHYAEATRR